MSNLDEWEATKPTVKSIDEIIAETNNKMDADPTPQGDNWRYRQSYLVGVLKANYQYLYNLYTRK
jgi:hypothetical protein